MKKVTELIFNFIFSKISLRKNRHPIYIIPTLDGLKVIILNFVLLAIGLTYANNYVLLFNFILFCLFLASMFYTHYNLQGISLVSIKANELFAKKEGTVDLYFTSKYSVNHFFIKPFIKLNTIRCDSVLFNITEQTVHVQMKIFPEKRGSFTVETIGIETRFPFGFFSCFTLFNTNHRLVVYPESKAYHVPLVSTISLEKKGDDPDLTFKNYSLGDNLKRVDWKKVAQTGKWFTKENSKQFEAPIILENPQGYPLEESLSSICYELQKMKNTNIIFGLKINGKNICPLGSGSNHVGRCMRELALYDT